jgi:hypothetical protein
MKMKVHTLFLFVGILVHQAIILSKAPDPNLVKKLADSKGATSLYIENKGQIGDQHGKPNTEVKYLILRPGLNIQLKANSFSYDAYTVERLKRVERLDVPFPSKLDKLNDDSLIYHFSRVDIELVDANPNPEITQEGASSDYLNYYTHITSQTKGEEGATGVRGYSNITYHDIYPNIDLEWFLDSNGKPEYQFIINPGGDPSRIRLKYHGAQKTELISEAIHIHIKPGIIKEHIPLSYLKESKEKLTIAFTKISNNEYGFNIPTYASNETLIIDPMPNRLWGTYYGSGNVDGTAEISIDNSGNIYIGGSTESTTDIASTGAWDVTLGSSFDAYLAKFTSNGNRTWGTYYGGNGYDFGNDLVTDANANVYLAGRTASVTDIASTGAWDVTRDNSYDGYLVKFSSNGVRLWGTYYGGEGQDNIYALAIDSNYNIFISGNTSSTNGIASAGAWDISLGGDQDAFLAKFSSTGSRLWGTYYGGIDIEDGYALATDDNDNVYLCGVTQSITDIASIGAWDMIIGGSIDGFLVKFSTSGIRLWGTYYGGSGLDMGRAILTDKFGNIYMSGYTESTTEIASTGAWDQSLGGDRDAFLVKFSTSGSRLWGTYFGGSGKDYGKALSINSSGEVFLGGLTWSSTEVATIGAWDASLGGTVDGYVALFNSAGSRIWGTYYGGPSLDDVCSMSLDSFDNLYITGVAASSSEIATIGAWDTTLSGSGCQYLVKLEKGFLEQITSPVISSTIYCQNQSFSVSYTVLGTFSNPNTFTSQLSDASGSFTNPIAIGSISSTTSGSINCRIPSTMLTGTGYRIRIISSNPSVIGSDNGTNIVINALPQPSISGSTSVCEGLLNYTYTVPSVIAHTYQWTSPSKGIIVGSTTGNSVSIRWTTAGIDSVKIRQTNTQTGCFKDTIIVVTIQPSPTPVISGSAAVCSNSQNNSYSVVNIPGHVYQWYAPTKGVITGSGTASSVNVHWTVAGVDSLKVRQTNPQTGCFKDTTLLITIQGLPTPVITGKLTVCISDKDDSYSIANIPGHVYQWFVPIKGTVIGSVTSNSVRIQWKSSGIDTIKVRQTNPQTGCYKDTTLIVVISAQPSQSISGVVNPCANNRAVQYSVPLKNNYSYQWGAIVRGTILGSRNGNSIEVVWKNPGIDSLTLRTTNTQTGCTSDTSFVVRISSAPLPVISGTRSVCVSANPVEYSVPTNSNSRYSWSQPKLGTLIGVNDGNTVRIRWNASGFDTVNVRETDLTTGCITDTFIVVNVLSQPKPIITGNAEVVEQEKGIVYSVQSENGSTYEWIIVSGDANITTKSGHLVVLNVGGRGAVVLKVIQTNVDGCINESQFVITVKAPTSVQDEAHSMFSVYPNPTEASDELLVQIADLHTRVLQIELVDMMGVTMVKTSIEPNNGIVPININGITSGMYIVRVHTANGIFSEKVIVN